MSHSHRLREAGAGGEHEQSDESIPLVGDPKLLDEDDALLRAQCLIDEAQRLVNEAITQDDHGAPEGNCESKDKLPEASYLTLGQLKKLSDLSPEGCATVYDVYRAMAEGSDEVVHTVLPLQSAYRAMRDLESHLLVQKVGDPVYEGGPPKQYWAVTEAGFRMLRCETQRHLKHSGLFLSVLR